ncbi:MAG: SDR family oxidoreductase, partial [Bacteroidia bacterium]|nr:SDR family oxidoreductase [Bacteroidia bacterium]
MKEFSDMNVWALILGGSSGLGLATAKKLARHGMNICVVHRNSRMQNKAIQKEFELIKREKIKFKAFNTDAFKTEKRDAVIEELRSEFGERDKIRVLVHSVAKGNLKLMVSEQQAELNADDFQLTINA